MLQEIAATNPASPLMFGYMYQSTLQTLEAQRLSSPPIKVKLDFNFCISLCIEMCIHLTVA